MKKIIVSVSCMLAIGLTTAFADNKTDVNSKIKQSFKKEFSGAELVTWTKIEDYQMARFIFYDHAAIAYFNEDGELLGSARNVLFDELPLTVIKAFDNKFADADVTEILEISNTDGISYLATVERKNKRYYVKVSTEGNILNTIRIK